MGDGRGGAGRRKGRRWPWGLLGMLGLVTAIEGTLAGHDLDFTAVWHWDWRVIGKAATRPDRVRDKGFLFFGDSLIKFGLMPRVIARATGKAAYNFALHTGQAPSSYFMLRRTLRAGARPSAIVLDLTPHMLMQGPEANKNLWAELLSAEECLDLARTMRDADFFARTMIEEALPSFKERREIRSSLMAALEGGSTSRRFEIPSYRRNWKLNEGAQLMDDVGTPPIDPHHWVKSLCSKWEPHPVNVAYLDRFLALAEERRIPVYWLLPPLHPDVQLGSDENLFDLSYSRFVVARCDRFQGTIVVDSRHSGFARSMFIDGAHVNRVGALRLSAAVAEVLRRGPDAVGSTRWVHLDLGKVRDFDGPIEDVNSSVVAARAESDAARR